MNNSLKLAAVAALLSTSLSASDCDGVPSLTDESFDWSACSQSPAAFAPAPVLSPEELTHLKTMESNLNTAQGTLNALCEVRLLDKAGALYSSADSLRNALKGFSTGALHTRAEKEDLARKLNLLEDHAAELNEMARVEPDTRLLTDMIIGNLLSARISVVEMLRLP